MWRVVNYTKTQNPDKVEYQLTVLPGADCRNESREKNPGIQQKASKLYICILRTWQTFERREDKTWTGYHNAETHLAGIGNILLLDIPLKPDGGKLLNH